MLASYPASMVNQKQVDLGIPNRFNLTPSRFSVAKRVLERIDAFIEELDDKNRMKTFGKVGLVVVVGNEDGAHHVAAEIYQALNDLGFSLPPTAVTYWVGEAMTGKEYNEFKKPPEKVAVATAMAAAGAAHLAKLLKANPYPGSEA